jgi:hypothetical protein
LKWETPSLTRVNVGEMVSNMVCGSKQVLKAGLIPMC